MTRTYLDHAATTPMVPEAIEAMTARAGPVGNASSLHGSGRAARRVVEESRESIAGRVGAAPAEVIFTSGGTESDNLAVKGGYWSQAAAGPDRGGHLGRRAPRGAGLGRLAGRSRPAPTAQLAPGRLTRPARPGRAGRGGRRRDGGGLGDVGQQRGRHAAAGRRGRRAAPPSTARCPTATPSRPSVTCRSTSRRSGLDLLTFTAHKLGGPYGVGRAARPPRGRPDRGPARRRTGARRPLRAPSTWPRWPVSPPRSRWRCAGREQEEDAAPGPARRSWSAAVRAAVPRRRASTAPSIRPSSLPGVATSASRAARPTRC